MAGNLEAGLGVVGGEWEELFEWLGIWGRGLELWEGPGSERGLGMDEKWRRGV